jgi:hypothetical protein
VYVSIYFVTPRDLAWHIETSWDRILRQLMPLLVLLAMFVTAPVIAWYSRKSNGIDP